MKSLVAAIAVLVVSVVIGGLLQAAVDHELQNEYGFLMSVAIYSGFLFVLSALLFLLGMALRKLGVAFCE